MEPSLPERRKKPFANIYFFPVAAFYAALILPWSVAGQFGWVWAPPGLASPLGHAHEMLFGFALAVVAGYVLGPRSRPQMLTLIGVWLAARLASLGDPASWIAALFNIAFMALLAWRVAPTYLRTAKKWRNKSVAVILLGLALTVLLFHGSYPLGHARLLYPLLLEAVLLLSALMFFMGGRILAPAMAGHLRQQKRHLKDRVQPRIEGGVLILLALALMAILLPFTLTTTVSGLLLLACALLTLLRTLRWRIWHCLNRADMLAMLLGYFWLIAGWALVGAALITQRPLTPALHAITIGALGTLTLTVMARTRMHRCLKNPNALPVFYVTSLGIALAALLRITTHDPRILMAAAGFWSLAYLCLLVLLCYLAIHERRISPVQRQTR